MILRNNFFGDCEAHSGTIYALFFTCCLKDDKDVFLVGWVYTGPIVFHDKLKRIALAIGYNFHLPIFSVMVLDGVFYQIG